ncbi:bifunctional diaminohydroxyphosphoribosylaminopyrimidine deaminase/5-amino-6-(5-phosphoribosylamino)uracil reductase RibD [Anaerococcus vaginalis]|uniref:Riboflavin biosynthesis protein RibD n=2 Tax=Anaerococcus vaginalis TaxID=33037 RepID=C7HTQ9_9FIRM|nr:bifunctional diaminohydroxyphosphoribosylaminopyrimidine deaminase/5-amino-6-(5-phosphoribosylamino)uracil reductase RibD [Anaerococcus vaginalis]EEU12940.1 riboflavin biosynthesis protein RibD [Anaerococcus vaginalis ATCC 51170]QQB62694.1 bifunctional diaminohydroxyphosphoribosylaminopyrimidine deaminase/5-amino-6-(5-phosphoribosylamino)uracil reductase RibD [Anaerococcus vaginalis]
MNDKEYMRKCFELAKKARGKTLTNPLVGAVLVKDNKIISTGFHHEYGKTHAEVDCFNNLKSDCDGAILYVNLEPCSHWGKQGPCTLEIIKRNIKKVIISNIDTNPKVDGLKVLKDNNIEVVTGLLEDEGKKLNEKFFFNVKYNRPLIALKFAQTLDGKISSNINDSKWISNESSRAYVHELRSDYDAIIVGKNTLIKDNPSLNSRIENGVDPVRIIVDTNLEIEKDYMSYKIFNLKSDKKTYIATCKDTNNPNLNIIKCKMKNNHVDLNDLANKLYKMKIGSILVEGGSSLNYGFLQEGLVDKIYEFISPKIISGFDSKSSFYGRGVDKIKDAYEFEIEDVKRFDDDIMIEAKNVHWNI